MSENENINKLKDEITSLYNSIKKEIPDNKLPKNIKDIQNINNIDSIKLINNIKEFLPLFINHKISESKTNIDNKFLNNDNDNKAEEKFSLKSENLQLESQLKKLEYDNRYYLKMYMKSEIQKKVLEMKLNAYMLLEEEYEELKEKVKYEDGKFLDNERKDNEIFILRAENSTLKKEIVKLESKIKTKDTKIKEHLKTIKDLQLNTENLNQKIYNMKKIIMNNNLNINSNNNQNRSLLKDKNNSMVDLKENSTNIFFQKIQPKTIFNEVNNIKSLYPQTYKLKRKINYFISPKNEIESTKNISNSNISTKGANSHLLATIYNKVNKHNKRNLKIPLMKENKAKSISVNNKEKRTIDELYRTNRRKIFKNILFSKPHTFAPESC